MLTCSRYACINAGEKLRQKRLPDFLIVGTQMAGTSSLCDILNQHSQIYFPPEKELHFFDDDRNYVKGRSFYRSFFSGAENAAIVGETASTCLFLPEAPGRIKKTLGDSVKIIIVLRNPAERAFAHFRMMADKSHEKRSLDEALNHNLKQLKTGINNHKNTTYLNEGLYAPQLENYFNTFPKENIRIFLFEEDFVENRDKMISDILEFIGVEQENINTDIINSPQLKVRNQTLDDILNTAHPVRQFFKDIFPSKKAASFLKNRLNHLNNRRPLPEGDLVSWKKSLIRKVFYEDIIKTEHLTGRDLSRWYKNLE
jgi:hypothetical protein